MYGDTGYIKSDPCCVSVGSTGDCCMPQVLAIPTLKTRAAELSQVANECCVIAGDIEMQLIGLGPKTGQPTKANTNPSTLSISLDDVNTSLFDLRSKLHRILDACGRN